MHVWARRGLKSALITGGMLVLGTGIASAEEQVNPDLAPSPLDGGASVPIRVGNIGVGTPIEQVHVPVIIDTVVTTDDLLRDVSGETAPLLRGNVVAPNVSVPVDVSGWAVGAAGDSHVVNESHQVHQQGGPITTSGSGEPVAGNVVAAPITAPVMVTGLALGTLSDATVENHATQESVTGGAITTSGDHTAASGNIVAVQGAVPVAVNNTGAGWGGTGTAHGETVQHASSPGKLTTDGTEGVVSGTAAGAPVALPVQVDGTAAGWGGIGNSVSHNTVLADAGTDNAGRATDSYATTGGEGSVVGGTVFTPQVAGPVAVNCTSGAWGGITDAKCVNDLQSEAGGGATTDGDGSLAGGWVGEAPVSTPVNVLGTAGAWGGESFATSANHVTSAAGGDVVTGGDDSAAAGTVLHPQVAGPVAVNCTTGPWGGITGSECTNDYDSVAGGGDKTGGADSLVGGTVADAPVSLPATGFNTAAAWGGLSDSVGVNTVKSAAGGDVVTSGENSVVGGTLAHPQTATPVSVHCNTGAWGGITSSTCVDEVTSDSGGGDVSNGDGSVGGGTIANVPVGLPVQVAHIAGDWGGISRATGVNTVDAEAGGNTYNHGDNSVVGGNVIGGQAAGAADVLGIAAAWGGIPTAIGSNTEKVASGGDIDTSGNGAVGSGNIVNPVPVAVAEVYGIAGAWGGIPTSIYKEDKSVTAGGDNNTVDDGGVVSSNIVTAPVAPVAQVFNIAGAWGGHPTSHVDSHTDVDAGGDNLASGAVGAVSGNVAEVPGALPVQVNAISATWGGNGEALGHNLTDVDAGGQTDTNGDSGAISGNVAEVPVGGAGAVTGWAVSWIGNVETKADNDVTSHAGGPVNTSGVNGAIAGDVIAAQAQPLAQVFGNTITAMANGTAETENVTDIAAGGPITTDGTGGAVSGDIVSAEAQAMPQIFGLAVSAIGSATNGVVNDLTAKTGGDETAVGDGSALNGAIVDVPVAADPEVFGWGVGALSHVDNTTLSVVDSDVSGTPAAASPLQIPVGLVPQVKDLTLPVMATVSNHVADVTDVQVGTVPASVIPIDLGGDGPATARSNDSAPLMSDPSGMSSLSGAVPAVAGKTADATGKVGATTGGVPGVLGDAVDK
ncbi:hypothetical protein C8D88_102879 [Lentzea atacamensis]|uniref:Small secreted domain n=1 Tax=Lentzea atacamensis TaxID=531938 RepID=A0A316IB80_9PSEU|nr:hypothetical protein [Lentzea atacamensis]PWK89604.1 hypothetical protein C8D88_102879 [Lentzea atacamensis]RAS60616.1 hypothetical protein C8D87_11134 [Lentzea atacamensis]